MKVEFRRLKETGYGDELLVSATEFLKAVENNEELASFQFATQAFFACYGLQRTFSAVEYERIRGQLSDTRNGSVAISVHQDILNTIPIVNVFNHNKRQQIQV